MARPIDPETDIKLRPAAEADVPGLLEMMARLCAEDGLSHFSAVPAEAALRRLLTTPEHGEVRLTEAGGRPAGYFVVTFGYSLEFHGRDAFLDELYVVPEHRAQGLGHTAIAAAERICREHGVSALHLEVERSNTRAQALYRKTGFVDHDRYLMTKRLGGAAAGDDTPRPGA